MNFNSLESIASEGFLGFVPIAQLQLTKCHEVPEEPGVYLVLSESTTRDAFLTHSIGGHFKGKDPTVSISELEGNWIEDALVFYIGKAGGSGKDATLRSRLKQYMRFGLGQAVGHYGGRYIWQLRDSGKFLICWKPTPTENPREGEIRLIKEFIAQYGKRPFANLVG